MIKRRILVLSLVSILCVPAFAYAGGNPPGQPFQNLQQQIDKLTQQLGALTKRLIPPTISQTLSCIDAFSLNIDLNITGNKEIAYFAIQEQGDNSSMNTITFIEPGLTSVNYQFTVEPGTEIRKFLFIALDTEGNTGKSLIEIKPDICFGPCLPGEICP
jgi:hypothetical protein